MRIGIDARTILNPAKNPAIGVGHYTFQLIRHLLKIDQRNQYSIFFDYRVREKDVKKFSRPNVKIKYFPWSDYKKYLPGAYSEILGLATLTGKNLDVLHTTSPDARVPLGYRGKVVTTFQDLSIYKYPEHFHKDWRVRCRYNRRAMAGRSDRIIAVSNNTKKDLRELFKVPEKKVSVIHNAVDERFFQNLIESKAEIKKDLEEKFRIAKDYILFVGTLEPIKNVTRLIQAFQQFKNENRKKNNGKDYQLVLAGKKGWLSNEYLQIAKDAGVARDVLFLGYVEGDDLQKLFKSAQLFVMPSLYEGFGMTVLEAMACGAPSLVSNINPLKEIAADGVEYVDPMGTEEIAKKMREIIENDDKKQAMVERGRKRAREFSWEKCAKRTLEVYKELTGK